MPHGVRGLLVIGVDGNTDVEADVEEEEAEALFPRGLFLKLEIAGTTRIGVVGDSADNAALVAGSCVVGGDLVAADNGVPVATASFLKQKHGVYLQYIDGVFHQTKTFPGFKI